jgi:hypothetical protein
MKSYLAKNKWLFFNQRGGILVDTVVMGDLVGEKKRNSYNLWVFWAI